MVGNGALKASTVLRNDDGAAYEVEAPLGQGGFGTTYSGYELNAGGRRAHKVCIKVCQDRHDWHGEAFFGRLLDKQPRVVRLHDAFVAVTGRGRQQKRRHVLVFEYMSGGTVWDAVEQGRLRWSEARVRAEIKALLKVLALLHNAGVTHRDLKPDNVYLRGGRLTLGDFGTTRMALDPAHSLVSGFAADFAPGNVLRNQRWGQADDVYQVGLLAATLLSGSVWSTDTVSVRAIAALPVSEAFKSWIWHATGARSKRYWDAADAVDALDALKEIDLRPSRAPRSLAGASVVLTGRIDGLSRQHAAQLARAAGAHVQSDVTDDTDVVVVGRTTGGRTGAAEGVKLFAAREHLRLGQRIRILSQEQFKRLVGT